METQGDTGKNDQQVFPKLLEAFEQDHVMLGRGFNQLSCCLRAGDLAGARAAARQLCEEAGAHIGFEEEDFYPALVPLLGEETVRRMGQEHCCGFDVISTLLNRGPDLPLDSDLRERLLAQSEVMEEHIAECGELFAAVRDIPPTKQEALYDRLIERRRHPQLDLECRTVGCGALRLAQCHPAAMPTGAFERSSVPVSKGLPVRVGSDERRELARVAARLIAEDPALVSNDALDPRTGSGIENGPALFYEDHSEIPVRSGARLDYRSRLLAGDEDIVLIGGRRRPEFEAYCRDLLGIGDATVVVPKGPPDLPLAKRCAQDSALLSQVCGVARRAGRLGLVPYLSSESAWTLASVIARQSGAPVWVAGPGPRLTRRVNDKLWFSERVAQVLGRCALPQTHYIFGPEALARRIARLAQDHDRVCIKVPDATGGAGNVVLEAKQVTEIPLLPLRQFLLQRLYGLGWRDRYPLLVGSWESPVVASPSVQLWIPHRTQGAPVAEAVFEQIVEAGHFVGATHRLPFPGARRYQGGGPRGSKGNRSFPAGGRNWRLWRMCRLYGFRATELTKVECTLVHAQNALITQSYKDRSGTSHLHGWGLAVYKGQDPRIERQALAASEDARFRRAAARAYSDTVLAHVRRATVGGVALENTHPFCHGAWAFVHNGTLPNFNELRPKLLATMTEEHRAAIRGETDSEYIFRMILSMYEAMPASSLIDTLRLSIG